MPISGSGCGVGDGPRRRERRLPPAVSAFASVADGPKVAVIVAWRVLFRGVEAVRRQSEVSVADWPIPRDSVSAPVKVSPLDKVAVSAMLLSATLPTLVIVITSVTAAPGVVFSAGRSARHSQGVDGGDGEGDDLRLGDRRIGRAGRGDRERQNRARRRNRLAGVGLQVEAEDAGLPCRDGDRRAAVDQREAGRARWRRSGCRYRRRGRGFPVACHFG